MTSEYPHYPPAQGGYPVEMTSYPYPASTAAQQQQPGGGYYYGPQSAIPVAPAAAQGYVAYPPGGQYQPIVITQAPAPGPGSVIVATQQPTPQSFVLHMLLSCFVFWCCGCLFGLAAFVLAGKWEDSDKVLCDVM